MTTASQAAQCAMTPMMTTANTSGSSIARVRAGARAFGGAVRNKNKLENGHSSSKKWGGGGARRILPASSSSSSSSREGWGGGGGGGVGGGAHARCAVIVFARADAEGSGEGGGADDEGEGRRTTRKLKIFSVNDVYELHNLSALKCFIEDNLEPGEEYLCTLNGDFLSPSLLSSLDLGAAAVSVMNAVPITHACLGNHEFDHSIETLGQRLGELECAVINSNVFACPPGKFTALPPGEEGGSAAAAAAALGTAEGVPYPAVSRVASTPGEVTDDHARKPPNGAAKEEEEEVVDEEDEEISSGGVGAFLDHLPRTQTVRVGDVTVGLMGLCTTSTPLSSAKKPKGVVFADCVPLAKKAARDLLPGVDAVVALTHQTLPEDARLAEEVPEIALILGGHEHTPFAGRMGHGANAAAALTLTPEQGARRRRGSGSGAGVGTHTGGGGGGDEDVDGKLYATGEAAAAAAAGGLTGCTGLTSTSECVNEEAGTLCVKAGMDAENVVVVTIEAPGESGEDTLGMDRGGLCTAAAAAAALAAAEAEEASKEAAARAAAKAHHDDFGHGGLWSMDDESAATIPAQAATAAAAAAFTADSHLTSGHDNAAAADTADGHDHHLHNDHHQPPPTVGPGEGLDVPEVSVKRPGSGVHISARMYSLRGYRTDPGVDADIWRRSEVLRGLNQHTLSLHEHGARLGLLPLSSRDSRTGQCSLGTLFATILRDECRADVCLYNSGGIRGNSHYGSDALTYGDLVAEVPFENNIITLEMTGEELAAAVRFSEAEQVRRSREGGSWGGYLQWDEGVAVTKKKLHKTTTTKKTAEIEEEYETSGEGGAASAAASARDDVEPIGDGDDGDDVEFQWDLTAVKGQEYEPNRVYRVVTWAGLLDGADDIPIFRDIGRRMATELHADGGGGGGGGGEGVAAEGARAEGAKEAPPAICGSDGIPFKIIVMRHLCRTRWRELMSASSFAELDADGDGLIRAADVVEALTALTASASAEQEAEAMVRSFDGDGDGALNARDVAELMEHFVDEDDDEQYSGEGREPVAAAAAATTTTVGQMQQLGRKLEHQQQGARAVEIDVVDEEEMNGAAAGGGAELSSSIAPATRRRRVSPVNKTNGSVAAAATAAAAVADEEKNEKEEEEGRLLYNALD